MMPAELGKYIWLDTQILPKNPRSRSFLKAGAFHQERKIKMNRKKIFLISLAIFFCFSCAKKVQPPAGKEIDTTAHIEASPEKSKEDSLMELLDALRGKAASRKEFVDRLDEIKENNPLEVYNGIYQFASDDGLFTQALWNSYVNVDISNVSIEHSDNVYTLDFTETAFLAKDGKKITSKDIQFIVVLEDAPYFKMQNFRYLVTDEEK